MVKNCKNNDIISAEVNKWKKLIFINVRISFRD